MNRQSPYNSQRPFGNPVLNCDLHLTFTIHAPDAYVKPVIHAAGHGHLQAGATDGRWNSFIEALDQEGPAESRDSRIPLAGVWEALAAGASSSIPLI